MNQSSTMGDGATEAFADAGRAFTKMWTDFASRMTSSGFSPPQQQSPTDAAKQMRDMFFAAWAEACEKYMRSAEFQQAMRESMAAAIELRKQMNEQLGDLQHTFQGVSRQDIDHIQKSIDHLEENFARTNEQLVDCLETVSARLDKLEAAVGNKSAAPAGKPAAKGRKTTKKRSP